MSDKRVSENGKSFSEGDMSISALNEAAMWADQLMEAEARSRREKEYTIRDRLAKNIGVKASALFRLQYKIEEMSDVKGSVYRALLLGMHAYGLLSQAAENAYEHEKELADARNSKMAGLAAAVAGPKSERIVK